MTLTITPEQSAAIADYVNTHDLAKGVGTKKSACSIAAINLALTGRLTDAIPDCMSPAIGRWIICIQDAMPATMRNSPEWKALLPHAAGTGRALERQRVAIAIDWMWSVLELVQDAADAGGYGDAWRAMCREKTPKAAARAARAARAAAAYAAADATAYAAYAADAAYAAARAADDAADDAAHAVYAARAAARAADDAAHAVYAARAAARAADDAFWARANPALCLANMINVKE